MKGGQRELRSPNPRPLIFSFICRTLKLLVTLTIMRARCFYCFQQEHEALVFSFVETRRFADCFTTLRYRGSLDSALVLSPYSFV